MDVDIIWFAKCFCFSPDSVSTITRKYEWHNRRLSVISLQFTEGNNQQDLDISKVGVRVMDELVEPLKKIKIDDTEFACLKALVFFDPSKCVSLINLKVLRRTRDLIIAIRNAKLPECATE